MSRSLLAGFVALFLLGCADKQPQPAVKFQEEKAVHRPALQVEASLLGGQRGEGQPYETADSEVWGVPDPVSGRNYQVFITLPRSYADNPERRYPVLYVTDADYAFPIIRQIGRRLNGEGPAIEEFILVGLSYAVGEEGMPSRRRDYTPTPAGVDGARAEGVHGESGAYMVYLRDQVLPFVARRYRSDESRRLFLGHSYGGLLGMQILLAQPEMFSGYILGSPSLWYDQHVMEGQEKVSAKARKDLPAWVYMYVGEYEERRYGKKYNMVSDARRMERTLLSRNYSSLHLKLEVLNDEDHLSAAPRGFTHGLKYLLAIPSP